MLPLPKAYVCHADKEIIDNASFFSRQYLGSMNGVGVEKGGVWMGTLRIICTPEHVHARVSRMTSSFRTRRRTRPLD